VSWYQISKTNLDFTEARDSEWQWHQLGHMQVCTSLQTDNHASTHPLFSTGRMPFPPPNQQRQSTEGKKCYKATDQKTVKLKSTASYQVNMHIQLTFCNVLVKCGTVECRR